MPTVAQLKSELHDQHGIPLNRLKPLKKQHLEELLERLNENSMELDVAATTKRIVALCNALVRLFDENIEGNIPYNVEQLNSLKRFEKESVKTWISLTKPPKIGDRIGFGNYEHKVSGHKPVKKPKPGTKNRTGNVIVGHICEGTQCTIVKVLPGEIIPDGFQ